MSWKHLVTIVAACALSWTYGPSARAIDVTPMVVRITPSGSNSSYRLSVKNTDDTPVTVELRAFRMEVDENGARTLTEEVNDLAIFPPQSIIPPNREQVVQVRYVGDPQAPARMYLVRIGQLPISFSSEGSQAAGAAVQVVFNVNTHVLMAPAGAQPDLQIDSTRRESNGDLLIVVENRGAGFAQLRLARYLLTGTDGQTQEIPSASVQLGQVSTLPAGAKRNVRIPAALISSLGSDISASVVLT